MLRAFPFAERAAGDCERQQEAFRGLCLGGGRYSGGSDLSWNRRTGRILGRVQGLLKEMGVSSLVFNYSGYGDELGLLSARRTAKRMRSRPTANLQARGHRSIVLLGFSLGSGVSGAVASRARCGWAGFVRRIFNVARGGDRDGFSAMDDTRGARCVADGSSR